MCLHANEPLIALYSLGISESRWFFLVLSGAGRTDDRGIHNCAPIHRQTVLLKILIDQAEQLITQIVALYQMAKVADRRLVRCKLVS